MPCRTAFRIDGNGEEQTLPARRMCIPFPDTLALEKNAAALGSASPEGLASPRAGVFLTVRENGMHTDGAVRAGAFPGAAGLLLLQYGFSIADEFRKNNIFENKRVEN